MNSTQTATTASDVQTITRVQSGVAGTAGSPQEDDTKRCSDFAVCHQSDNRHGSLSVSTEQQPVAKRTRRNYTPTSLVAFGGLALGIILAGGGTAYMARMNSWVKTDNAYLAAHIHTVSSRLAGTVAEVLVDENQTVGAGTLLARLDPRDFELRREQALAQLAGAHAQVQEATAHIARARAQIASDQARSIKSQNDLARAVSLFEHGSGAISKQELDLARAESDASQAALDGARSAFDSATASETAAQAQEQAANVVLQDADQQLSYTRIIAPAAGRIGKKNLEIGNRVQPGQSLLSLVQPDIWVNANFKETQLAHLRPGQAARVKVDAFPGRTLRGTVESLSPASGAEFALLPPDNATGNFTKIVRRVPVKIVLDDLSLGDCAGRLVAGMSALVEVDVH